MFYSICVCVFVCGRIFFFKQRTAYELRISVWSSDVCSSDLQDQHVVDAARRRRHDSQGLEALQGGRGGMSARGNVSAEEWRAMARAAVAGQPGLLVADGDGPPRLAADVLAEAAAEQQQAELDARALLAAGDAMAGDSA